jgi:hypothetical protein
MPGKYHVRGAGLGFLSRQAGVILKDSGAFVVLMYKVRLPLCQGRA